MLRHVSRRELDLRLPEPDDRHQRHDARRRLRAQQRQVVLRVRQRPGHRRPLLDAADFWSQLDFRLRRGRHFVLFAVHNDIVLNHEPRNRSVLLPRQSNSRVSNLCSVVHEHLDGLAHHFLHADWIRRLLQRTNGAAIKSP